MRVFNRFSTVTLLLVWIAALATGSHLWIEALKVLDYSIVGAIIFLSAIMLCVRVVQGSSLPVVPIRNARELAESRNELKETGGTVALMMIGAVSYGWWPVIAVSGTWLLSYTHTYYRRYRQYISSL